MVIKPTTYLGLLCRLPLDQSAVPKYDDLEWISTWMEKKKEILETYCFWKLRQQQILLSFGARRSTQLSLGSRNTLAHWRRLLVYKSISPSKIQNSQWSLLSNFSCFEFWREKMKQITYLLDLNSNRSTCWTMLDHFGYHNCLRQKNYNFKSVEFMTKSAWETLCWLTCLVHSIDISFSISYDHRKV